MTVAGAVLTATFTAGGWVRDIRADLHMETVLRTEHEAALAVELANRLKDDVQQRATINGNVQNVAGQIAAIQSDHAQLLATLARIDRSFQHMFSVTQPQPAARK
jgi:hypothetical protein